MFSPQGAGGQCCANSGGGGGGWTGGAGNGCGEAGRGGTSCGQGMLPSTILSASAISNYVAPNAQSPFYVAGRAVNQGGGLVVISWDGLNTSPSISGSLTQSLSPSRTAAATASLTSSRTAGSTASMTVTPTGTENCKPQLFSRFIDNDLAGSSLSVSFTSSERGCQEQCCSSIACQGYVFDNLDLLRGRSSAPCFILANVTERIPSSGRIGGVLTS